MKAKVLSMRLVLAGVGAVALLTIGPRLEAHGGGLDRYGCHHN